jgi:uncharacterized protein YndB with AHSA1/START domain
MTAMQATTPEQAQATTQVHRVYVRATPDQTWRALTDAEQNGRYGYGAPGHYELRPGGAYRSYATEEMKQAAAGMGWELPEVIVDGEVLEVDPPRRLVQTWRMLMDPTAAGEGFSRLT